MYKFKITIVQKQSERLHPRNLSAHLKELTKFFRVISLTGPRQSGKTTLLNQLFPSYRYVCFEVTHTREAFEEDPLSFLLR